MRFDTEKQLYSVIGQNIKYYREQANMTQAELSIKCGISLSYLTKIEAPKCNKSISLALLNEIANSLNLDITMFFQGR